MNKTIFPNNKKFAFTIFDDTDLSKPGNYELVYDFLADLGFRTTKSVWPLAGKGKAIIEGSTIEDDPNFLVYHQDLQILGFEIGYHCSSFSPNERAEIIRGFELFKKEFGHYPKTMSNHADSKEAIYWGDNRVGGVNQIIYNMATRFRQKDIFKGHVKDSKYFWGDLCLEHIKYVRNFITSDMNTLKVFPQMPYHDVTKPFVPYWYGSSEGPEVHSFNKTISESAQDQLEKEGGACIMYTHFACGFVENGRLNPRFKTLMERLAKKDGWFVPVGTLLDHLAAQDGDRNISSVDRSVMEMKWILHKIKIGGTS